MTKVVKALEQYAVCKAKYCIRNPIWIVRSLKDSIDVGLSFNLLVLGICMQLINPNIELCTVVDGMAYRSGDFLKITSHYWWGWVFTIVGICGLVKVFYPRKPPDIAVLVIRGFLLFCHLFLLVLIGELVLVSKDYFMLLLTALYICMCLASISTLISN